MSTPQEVISLAASEGAEFVDIRFTDVPGVQHHFSIPLSQLTESVFEDGLGFDGSSVRGFQTIDASDMVLIPDPDTAFFDPFMKRRTLVLLADVKDPVTGEMYAKDPRGVVRRALAYMASTGIADTAYFGPEAEFFIFDSVAFQNQPDVAGYQIRSAEGIFESGRSSITGAPSPGHRIPYKTGYFPLSPMDTFQDLRSEMVVALESVGIPIELQHHEVGTAGQAEIDMVFDEMLVMADRVQLYKYVVKNVAREHGHTVTFMPKPIYGDNGSGMHTHQSLWMDGESLMYDERGYAGLSDLARWYIGGLIRHAPAVLAFAAPTTNSYKRLVPGYEAPVNLAYSQRNRSAAIRIPLISDSPKAKRLEFRCPDPSANPYLAFAAMLMAGLDGVQNQIDPGEPLDKNIYDLPPEEAAGIPTVPGSLSEALRALEDDHDFLLAGDVFSTRLVESYLEVKQEEVDAVSLRPHPIEFEMYYSV
ncbi:type I glutamate--ammonia ligase [Candidatus Poriferisocius sp.]|uniref:type I glutamate--ammonia ligase n=1 Tax=Candidatus Poriferisocius sp. TaxID=3101276 RepID=UPI003B027266